MHMHNVTWDALAFYTGHFLTVFDYDVITSNLSRNDCSVVLYCGMCKVTSHFGGSSAADVHRYVAVPLP